ncbi:GreA/GreB family elongation factor [Albibacterium indicum]|uniref:GreA/GreB family elongation factor n=1 Tax=Albibacterium indicum TaxID=2292082 RepID=UPI000E515893|nr:GreA/GreB family elongation factor [Pedobacter indicus]
METSNNNVVLSEEDYNILRNHVTPNPDNPMSLAYELSRAKVVKKDKVPADRVKINSLVTIEDQQSKVKTTVTIVEPANADMKQQKVSFLTPIGSALIGFKIGDEVEWKMPVGIRKYKILEVTNP